MAAELAYSLLTVKALDSERRTITGIASTPEPDRVGDIVDPAGITFKTPTPLLLYHDPQRPVGQVTFGPWTAAGLPFEATLPMVVEPGTLRDRIEEAWQSIKAGLLVGVSIGYLAREKIFNKATGGYRFPKAEIFELSLVTVPANSSATIQTIKSLDLAAPGRHPSRVRDPLPIVRVIRGARYHDQATD